VTSLRPTPQQERWLAVVSRLGLDHGTPWIVERVGGWTAASLLPRCAFFVLGSLAAGLTTACFHLVHVPGYLLVSGLASLAAAEWLIVRRRLFAVGIEEALEVAGMLLIALQLVDQIGDLSGIRASLLIATVLLAAGVRLLNPLFTTMSAVAFSCAIGFAGAHPPSSHAASATMASAFCFAVALSALFLGQAEFRRPSYDQMLNGLIVILPLSAYLWLEGEFAGMVRFVPTLMLAGFGGAALLVGVRRRNHAPIVAFLVCVGCLACELRNLTGLSLKVKLIFWGSASLLLTIALDRYLRNPRQGVTSIKVGENNGAFDLIHLAGAGALTPLSTQQSEPPFKGGGGAGGGGGASESY
jgi:hypothetical protein